MERLADGEYHSGEALGELLGVSRTAVWKHLQKLEDVGIALESVRGKGYRLKGGMELLDKTAVESLIDASVLNMMSGFDVMASVDSTNRVAMARAQQPGAKGYVCVAEHQTAGRGRRGRQWISPYGQSLYLSAVAEFDGGAAALEGLSLAVGVVVAEALQECGVDSLSLKWPNDVLRAGRKLAGVLLEMTGDPAGQCSVVVGIGVNVALSPASTGQIDQPWSDLSDCARSVSRNQLVANLLNRLIPMLANYQRETFGGFRRRWLELHHHQGAEVAMVTPQARVEGVVEGITDSGALLLRVPSADGADGAGELREFNGGEVTLRGSGTRGG